MCKGAEIMKKILKMAATLLILSASISVYAGTASLDVKDISFEDNIFCVSGDVVGGDVVGYVVKDTANEVVAIGEAVATDNAYSFDFELPEDTVDKKCTVFVSIVDGTKKEKEFVNYSQTIGLLINSTSKNDLKNIFDSAGRVLSLDYLGFSPGEYNTLSSEKKDMVCENIENDIYNDLTAWSLKSDKEKFSCVLGSYNKYLGLELINKGKADGLDKINPISDGIYYNEIQNTAHKSFIAEKIIGLGPYVLPGNKYNFDEFNKQYNLYNIIYLCRISTPGKICTLIEDSHSDLIGNVSEYSDFSGFSDYKKNEVANILLTKNNIQSVAEFVNEFKAAVTNVKNNNAETASGAGAGSGGGGGGAVGSGSGFSVAISSSNNTNAISFSDIQNYKWAAEAIDTLAKNNIIVGTGDGKFSPEREVTREQLVKMVIACIGSDNGIHTNIFSDVKSGEWYQEAVAEAYDRKIISGMGDNLFGVGKNITRQDLAVIIVNAARVAGLDGFSDLSIGAEDFFVDYNSISEYAKNAVCILFEKGVVSGREGRIFAPLDYCTRAEAAKIIYNTFFMTR